MAPSMGLSPSMDTSHFKTSGLKPLQGNIGSHEFREATPIGRDDGRDVHVDIKPDQSSRFLAPSDVGVTVRKPRKTLVLCFDGTGNEFHGDSSDSNILKIFRMLDRSSGKGFHYYQPGIGTYVASASLSSSGTINKIKNWYLLAKDSAVGTSFDDHVVGGYKFLMQYYSPGDNIYMFGFSRGSYTARFLAEMIDWIGLITHGNEEMIQFAWKTFSKWKEIDSNNKEAALKSKKAYNFMVAFRETFSRPVRRIRFLGLFDTVNSVPRFENAVLSRKRIPFSAISSAKIIRHAVSIDERRAKFRADLVAHGMAARRDERRDHDNIMAPEGTTYPDWIHRMERYSHKPKKKPVPKPKSKPGPMADANPQANAAPRRDSLFPVIEAEIRGRRGAKKNEHEDQALRYRSHSRAHSRGHSQVSHTTSISAAEPHHGHGLDDHDPRPATGVSEADSMVPPVVDWDDGDLSSDGDEDDQDIEELWFPGGHADIGGGWDVGPGETPLSHVPLVWIVREARKSGLDFDEDKMQALNCLDDTAAEALNMPVIEISTSGGEEKIESGSRVSKFKSMLMETASKAMLHDCLRFKQGSPAGTVIRWQIMEYMPFRRLDLREDGKWQPIRWPLPRGEVRDMPTDAKIHRSAIRRMENNPEYRPGNLICGGGGRGYIKAPKHAGIGEWKVVGEEGDIVGERVVMVRSAKETAKEIKEKKMEADMEKSKENHSNGNH